MKSAVWLALREAIAAAGLPCEAFASGLAIEVGECDLLPDVVVNAGAPMGDDAVTVPNPVVVVDIVGSQDGPEGIAARRGLYFGVPSLSHYVVVGLHDHVVEHHRRGLPAVRLPTAAGGTITCDELSLAFDGLDWRR